MIGNYIKAVAVTVSRSTAQLMKTGQTTSYRTGDDGDLERGRNTSFTVLAENNPFGNTNRFTDELGGQTYTKNIVIDWSTYDGSTVLGWRRTRTTGVTWNQSIDGALLVSIAPFTTGWRVPNITELQNILNFGTALRLNYAPFNISTAYNLGFWTSTSVDNSTAFILMTQPYISMDLKVYMYGYIPCRTFTVTGTTLS